MKNLFKQEDFETAPTVFFDKYKAAELANEKLNKLIEDSQTVYGYGITPMASSLWNMNGPEKERCPHTHQAKLMFIEPIAKKPCKHEPREWLSLGAPKTINEKLKELELKNEKLMAENEEFKKLLEKVRNCKVGDLVLYHPTDDVDSHYVFEAMNKLKAENENLKSGEDFIRQHECNSKLLAEAVKLNIEVNTLKSDLKIAMDALNEIKAYGHSENCRIMKPYRDHYRCTFEEAEEALKKIEGEK